MNAAKVSLVPGGLAVSRLVAGVWRLNEWGQDFGVRRAWLDACLDAGIDTFDHADLYGHQTCEGLFGDLLRAEPSLRDRLTLITKCGIRLAGTSPSPDVAPLPIKVYDTGTAHIRLSAENSLARLGTDRLDLLLLHRPDPLMDADAVAKAFLDLKRDGKVLHFGVSNFSASQMALLQDRLPFPLATNQVELSAWKHDLLRDPLIDTCQTRRIRPMAWSPLGGGRIGQPGAVTDAIAAVAGELGESPEAVALAWLMKHPAGIVPVLGTGRPERLKSQARAASLSLEAVHWYRIYEAGLPGGLP